MRGAFKCNFEDSNLSTFVSEICCTFSYTLVCQLSGFPPADGRDGVAMSHRLSMKELDEQFELFLKESVSDDSVDLGVSEKQPSDGGAKKAQVSWWQDDEDGGGGGGAGRGLSGSGKSFRKSLRKSHSIREEDEEPGDTGVRDRGPEPVVLSRDHTETEDLVKVPAVNMTSLGLDTLEEEEEKARFFAQIEAGASSTIDYSKLNRELDSTSDTVALNLRKIEEAVEQNDDVRRKAGDMENIRTSPGSPHYSEDFEEEEDVKEPLDEKSKMSPIIAKVCLYDSLDDTGGGGKEGGKHTAGSVDTGHSHVKSGGSEMEALHDAYRQIHVVEDSDDCDHNHHNSTMEGREERLLKSVSPTFPAQHDRQSLQPASTNESDLPTAEELMRPIRIEEDHTRGFSLRPISAVEEKPPCSLEKTFPDVTCAESQQLKRLGKADAAATTKGAKEYTRLRPGSPDLPKRDLTWSIRAEVATRMEDQSKTTSHKFPQAGKVTKQSASRSSALSHPSTSSVRKPVVAPVRGRRVEGRAAVTSRSSGISRVAAPAKSPPRPSRAKSTKSPNKDDNADPGLRVSSELVASVQSLVAVLQQQIDTNSHQENRLTSPPPEDNREEEGEDRSLVEELSVRLAQKERELQAVMKDGDEELNALRQQNYVLQSKLRSAEEAYQRRRWAEATDSAPEGTFQQMDKELKEQEALIKGYQQENEKLYLQLKAQQAKSKSNEDAMFSENQRLLSQLTFTREQLIKPSRPVGNVCVVDHTQHITDLLAQINTSQRNEAKLNEDVHRLKQENQALEVDLQLLKRERDLAKAQVVSTSGDKTFELRALEETHREEVSALKKKLQWFADNQELLDRDAGRLTAAAAQIHQLKEQVENLKMEVKKSEQQRKARDKSADTKKMQDLQRQVKELEQILRHRNPNSLPALIYAAASAEAAEEADTTKTSAPDKIVALLEHRIQRLEAELESHDEEAKRSLRAMEQRFHGVKLRYEQQISELEQQLEQKQQVEVESSAAGSRPLTSQVQTLEAEEKDLQQMKEIHLEKEKSPHDQVESLQQQLRNRPSSGRHQRQAEDAFRVRLERMNHELAAKTRSVQELSRTVERLQRERRNMLSVPDPQAETQSTETQRKPAPARTLSSVTSKETPGGEETFPAAHNEKTYQPTVFAGSHISEVLQENEALTQRLELLQLQAQQEKEARKADAARAEEELRRLLERRAEQLSSLKAEHLQALDRQRAAHALEHSSSKVAEQANQLVAQEIKMKHLQDQLKELQGTREALTVSRTREGALQRQLAKLLSELKEAQEAQSSEVKLLCGLERKIVSMELRHQHREMELTQVIGGSWHLLEAQQPSEVERWKHLAQDKSRELEAFRLELDSILDVLKHLQRQGVVFPPTPTSSSS
uniref:Centrosomal protein of 162 kDa n=2 Tax=Scophthalmus maximus TaxID=52904 RepID=A0A8D3ANA8_SCOMX